ncbi:unnamed protein product [Fusarium venenatum]|uniref:Uncharacterized protein n=1 Tax=Fusarium venenatum TaxID=56646 RepID=A0A2L2TE96_9HYPO|nr:uncharacterized protein FVRRES_07163 [Fusarium venenatum]CEI62727.1 unnamed protein product [Fusarium venenatum]
MSMKKYGLGYKGTNSYNEMDGRRRKTEKRQQLDRAEASPTAVGWTGGQKQKGKEGWSAGQARLMDGVPAQRQLMLKREPERTTRHGIQIRRFFDRNFGNKDVAENSIRRWKEFKS